MLTELRNTLAALIAVESRFHELVDPEAAKAAAVLNVVKSTAASIEKLAARVEEIANVVEHLIAGARQQATVTDTVLDVALAAHTADGVAGAGAVIDAPVHDDRV